MGIDGSTSVYFRSYNRYKIGQLFNELIKATTEIYDFLDGFKTSVDNDSEGKTVYCIDYVSDNDRNFFFNRVLLTKVIGKSDEEWNDKEYLEIAKKYECWIEIWGDYCETHQHRICNSKGEVICEDQQEDDLSNLDEYDTQFWRYKYAALDGKCCIQMPQTKRNSLKCVQRYPESNLGHFYNKPIKTIT